MDLTPAGVENAVEQWLDRTTTQQRRVVIRDELNRLDLGHHHIGGAFVPMYCLPVVLTQDDFRRIADRAQTVVEALNRLETAALRDPDGQLYARLRDSLSPGGRHLVSQFDHESDFSLRHRFRRLDGSLGGGHGYQVIEVNQAAPLASSYHDTVHRLSSALLQRLGLPWRPRLMAPAIAEWLVAEYQQRYGGDRLPQRVAIPVEHDYPPKFSDLPAIAAAAQEYALARWGERIEFTVCLPWELSPQGDRIRLRGKTHDMIWRNTVYLTRYRAQGPDVSEYERLCANPARYLIVNSGRAWLTRTKEALAMLWDDNCAGPLGLPATELDELRRTVPQTRNLKYQPEYLDEVLSRRRDWVVKPTDSGFGAGVEFGADHTDASWRELVRGRTGDGQVFQRVVPPQRLTLTQLSLNGEMVQLEVEADLCPYHVNGEASGPILMRAMRVAPQPTAIRRQMNLTQGGGLLPVLVAPTADPPPR